MDRREEGRRGRAGGREAGKKNDFDTEWRRRAAIQSRRKPSARQMRWCSVATAAAADGQRAGVRCRALIVLLSYVTEVKSGCPRRRARAPGPAAAADRASEEGASSVS